MKWLRRQVGWIAGLAVGGMVLWLISTAVTLQTTSGQAAGILFGRRVPVTTYLKAVEAVTHQAILRYGDRYRQQAPSELLKEQAWERLTLLAEARRKKIRVSDPEVIEELQKWPIFQTGGRFDWKGYQTIVQYSLGTSPRNFEEEIREGLMMEKLVDQVMGRVEVTEEELKESFRRKEESIQVTFFHFPDQKLAEEVFHATRQRPKELTRIAKALNLKTTTTDFFKRESEIPEVGKAGLVLPPAFLLEPGEIAGPFLGEKGWLLARLEAKRPADEERFYQVKESLKDQLLTQKRFTTYLKWYQDLLRRANPKKAADVTQAAGKEDLK